MEVVGTAFFVYSRGEVLGAVSKYTLQWILSTIGGVFLHDFGAMLDPSRIDDPIGAKVSEMMES